MNEFELVADEFTEADRGDLVGFSCGDSMSGRLCTQWICGSGVFDSLRRKTKVWLYRNQSEKVVGYSSVGFVSWRWPLPDGNYTTVLYIPMIGIDQQYHGQPPEKAWRYSHQIMNHLIWSCHQMNQERKSPVDWLTLKVLPDNAGAIRLYNQFDFELIANIEQNHGLRVMKHRLAD
jgi:ribosomal protein S18 acetylase RimI-like enzyme